MEERSNSQSPAYVWNTHMRHCLYTMTMWVVCVVAVVDFQSTVLVQSMIAAVGAAGDFHCRPTQQSH